MANAKAEGPLVRPDAQAFDAVRDISIDYAVMEHSEKVLVVPVSFAWSDVGSWDAVRDLTEPDRDGNVLQGDVLALDCRNSFIRNEADMIVAAVGLEGFVCVVTGDAVFIAPLDRAQDAKRVVEELRARGDKRV
jgi:mannose-1-phosphate guanylyltransferase